MLSPVLPATEVPWHPALANAEADAIWFMHLSAKPLFAGHALVPQQAVCSLENNYQMLAHVFPSDTGNTASHVKKLHPFCLRCAKHVARDAKLAPTSFSSLEDMRSPAQRSHMLKFGWPGPLVRKSSPLLPVSDIARAPSALLHIVCKCKVSGFHMKSYP